MHLAVGEETPQRVKIITGRVFVNVGAELLEFDFAGRRLASHTLDSHGGGFGPGADEASCVYSTATTVYVIECRSGRTVITPIAGAGPAAVSADAVLFSRGAEWCRLERGTGEVSAWKRPLRKALKSWLGLALPDGRTFFGVDPKRQTFVCLDSMTGKKTKHAPIPLKNVDELYSSVPVGDDSVVMVERMKERVSSKKSQTLFSLLRVQDAKVVRRIQIPGGILNSFAVGRTHIVVQTNRWVGCVTVGDGALVPWELEPDAFWKIDSMGDNVVVTRGPAGLELRDAATGQSLGEPVLPRIQQLKFTAGGALFVTRAGGSQELFVEPADDSPSLTATCSGLAEGCDATAERIVHWTPTTLTLIESGGSRVLDDGADVWNAALAGDDVLVLGRGDGGEAESYLLNLSTSARRPVSLRPSERRSHLWLAPGASYAVSWEGDDLVVYPDCGGRAAYKERHVGTNCGALVFTVDAARFAYVTTRREAFVATPKEGPRRVDLEHVSDAASFGDELWVLAAGDVFKVDTDGVAARVLTAPDGASAFAVGVKVFVFAVDGERIVVERG